MEREKRKLSKQKTKDRQRTEKEREKAERDAREAQEKAEAERAALASKERDEIERCAPARIHFLGHVPSVPRRLQGEYMNYKGDYMVRPSRDPRWIR